MTDETLEPAATPGTPRIFAAIEAITDEIPFLEKTGRGPSTQSSYPFLPVDNIVAALNPLLRKHHVVTRPHQREAYQELERFPKVNLQGEPVYDGRAPGAQIHTRVHYAVEFISSLDGSSFTSSAFGEALDTGDKGLRKASTAAFKEILLRTFAIVSGTEDPDAIDPNDEPPQQVRQDRGAQQRDRAAAPKTERAPRQPRQPRGKAAETPAAESAATESAAEAPADPPVSVPAESAAPSSAPAKVREEQTPAEQRSEDWKVDPEDVAAAEQMAPPEAGPAPAAAARTPREPRTPRQPVAKPEPETEGDKHYESVADVRNAIREALKARDLPRDMANDLGDELTGKPRGNWFASLPDLRKVLKAIEAGEVSKAVADANESGF